MYAIQMEAAMLYQTCQTANDAWGFWGTIRHRDDPAEAWPIAMRAVVEATGCSDQVVRNFLDSRHGRHFADDVANGLFKGLALPAAIAATVERWMGGVLAGNSLARPAFRTACPI